jgi:hypothetical protein
VDKRAKAAASLRRWRTANPDKAREQSRRQRRVDPERDLRWRTRNPAEARAAERNWRQANKDKRNAITAAYNARRKGLTPVLTVEEQAKIMAFYSEARAMTELTGEPYHVDHIKPLAKGGPHHPANLQVLRGVENQRKGARW